MEVDNLGKMAKNSMKITKSTIWGQNSEGYGEDNPNFRVVRDPPH